MLEPAVPPVNDIAEIRRALVGTVLEGCEVVETPILDTGEVSFEILFAADRDFSDARRDAVWNAARGLVGQLGRWPVVVGDSGENLFGRYWYGEEDGDNSPRAVIDRSLDVFVPDVIARRWAPEVLPGQWAEWVEQELVTTEERVASRPSAKAIAAVPDWDLAALERVLFEFEEARQATADAECPEIVQGFENECGCISLLPTVRCEEVLAYTHYYGAGESVTSVAEFIAVLRGWRRRHGADVRTVNGVVMDLVLHSPPADAHSAYELAVEYSAYAQADDGVRMTARALIGAPVINLFQRP